jgi:hypothetical protein
LFEDFAAAQTDAVPADAFLADVLSYPPLFALGPVAIADADPNGFVVRTDANSLFKTRYVALRVVPLSSRADTLSFRGAVVALDRFDHLFVMHLSVASSSAHISSRALVAKNVGAFAAARLDPSRLAVVYTDRANGSAVGVVACHVRNSEAFAFGDKFPLPFFFSAAWAAAPTSDALAVVYLTPNATALRVRWLKIDALSALISGDACLREFRLTLPPPLLLNEAPPSHVTVAPALPLIVNPPPQYFGATRVGWGGAALTRSSHPFRPSSFPPSGGGGAIRRRACPSIFLTRAA